MKKGNLALWLLLTGLALAVCACTGKARIDASLAEARPVGKPVQISAPLGLPALPPSPENPPTAETIELGRRLFYDTRLSGNNAIACASCHNPLLGFSDGKKHSTGFGGKLGVRNSPTVLNAVYSPVQFWDGRAADLEEQAAHPIANPIEMNQPHDACVIKIGNDPSYAAAFTKAFGPGAVTIGKVQKAIAAFERTLLSANSPFDRYQYGGDRNALSPAAVRGLALFKDKAKGNCVTCHTIGEHDAIFQDGKFHNLGVGINYEGEFTDLGRYEQTKVESDKGAFKTPTLRNVAQSAPYMHDGSLRTLRDVVDFYAGGGNSNPHLDRDIKPLTLSRAERDDLVAFLESLTGEQPANAGLPTARK